MPDDLEIRVGDEERQATIDRLARHYRAGRLSADELEERTTAAHEARNRGQLRAVERDLPDLAARDVAGERRREGLREHLATYAVVIGFLWIVWALTGAGYPWPIWPMLGWGLGLALHAATGRPPERLPGPPLPPGLPRPPRERDDRR